MIRIVDEKVLRTADGSFRKVSELPVDMRKMIICAGLTDDPAENTLAWRILSAHRVERIGTGQNGSDSCLGLRFDVLASPDDNYVSTLQEFRAFGRDHFELPWVFTNCHNAMACTGGTVSSDDHIFGLDCVKKYGGIYVPPYCAVIHQYMREQIVESGQLILASDSHTRYGPLGAMGIGEGGTEVARQAAGDCYTMSRPKVIAVSLRGQLRRGVGSMDVALAFIRETFARGICKNAVMEISGPALPVLSMEFRIGLDAMTTEAGAYATIWETDEKTRQWFIQHNRPNAYCEMRLEKDALYDGLVEIDLSKISSMIALPFHPSNTFPIKELCGNRSFLEDVLRETEREALRRTGDMRFTMLDKIKDGHLTVQSASIGGCVGGMYENLQATARILEGYVIPAEGVPLGIYPASFIIRSRLDETGVTKKLTETGAVLHPSICGPCFGTLDIPAHNTLAVRHVTRNYYSREGSKAEQGQMSAVALMDARSIASTIRNGGMLTSAEGLIVGPELPFISEKGRTYNNQYYRKAVYNGYGAPNSTTMVRMGPGIKEWPEMPSLGEHLLLKVIGKYEGSITTDELCPSGEASALRSDPERLSAYTLVSRDSRFVEKARKFKETYPEDEVTRGVLRNCMAQCKGEKPDRDQDIFKNVSVGSLLIAEKVGDGSSREQSASNQKILGIWADLATSYSNKRYRSNCINWGLLPLQVKELPPLEDGEYLFLPGVREALGSGTTELEAWLPMMQRFIRVSLGELTDEERNILSAGGLINFMKKKNN